MKNCKAMAIPTEFPAVLVETMAKAVKIGKIACLFMIFSGGGKKNQRFFFFLCFLYLHLHTFFYKLLSFRMELNWEFLYSPPERWPI